MVSDRGNITVQERLFDRMDDFLKLKAAIPQMADLLSEVRMLWLTYYVNNKNNLTIRFLLVDKKYVLK